MSDDSQSLLTTDEVAAFFRVTAKTIWRWRASHRLVGARVGRAFRFRRAEVERLLRETSDHDSGVPTRGEGRS